MESAQQFARVCVVEDPFIRSFVKSYLARHRIEGVALELDQAVEMLRRDRDSVRALITNQPSPFAEFAPELPLVYIASAPDPTLAKPFRLVRMLRKPFQPKQLLQAMQELLDVADVA